MFRAERSKGVGGSPCEASKFPGHQDGERQLNRAFSNVPTANARGRERSKPDGAFRTFNLTCRLIFMPIIFGILSIVPAHALKISKNSKTGQRLELLLTGPIVAGDAGRLVAFIGQKPKDPIRSNIGLGVRLDSEGGNVDEALKIGRILRSHNAFVQISGVPKQRCASSCVFIYMARVIRIPGGNDSIGIHRPYLARAQVGDNFEQNYKSLRGKLDAYFDEMHVSKALLDLMFSTPPERTRFLTEDEIDDYLPLQDPVFNELRTTQAASVYNITNAEYRRRDVLSGSCTTRLLRRQLDAVGLIRCTEAILFGIPESALNCTDESGSISCVPKSWSRRSK